MGDWSPYWFNSPHTFTGDMNMWWSTNAFGCPSPYPALAGLFAPMFILQEMGIANGLIQVIVISTLLICSGLTMLFFLSTILGRKGWPLLIGSLFYMLCMIFILEIFSLVISWAHAFLPLVLALFVKLIQKKVRGEPSGKWLVGFLAAFSFFMSFLFDNPPILIIGLFCLFIVFIYLGLTEGIFKVTRESLKMVPLTILVSLWWIIPAILTSMQVVDDPGQNLAKRIILVDARSSILNVLWFNPIWSWKPEYYPYTQYYANPIVIFATFVPVIVAAIGLLSRRQNKKLQYLFIIVVLLGIAVDIGGYAPFGQLKSFLDAHIPLFGMLFREPQSKVSIVIALFLAPLVACSLDSILAAVMRVSPYTKLRRNIRKILPPLLVLLFISASLLSAGPIFLNKVAETKSSLIPYSSYVNVPAYWDTAGQFFDNDSSDFRVLITPDSPSTYMAYDWGYWGSDAVPYRFIHKPVLFNTYGYQQKAGNYAINLTYQTLGNHSYTEFNNLLSTLNVKYILQRNDITANFTIPQAVNSTVMKNDLLNDSTLEYITSFGELDIYEYKNWNPTHLLASTEPFEDNSSALTTFSAPNDAAAGVSYQQVSPSEYSLHINASKPFFLFFSEGYDSKWKLTEADANWYTIPFSQDLSVNHTSAYGYGNMWYITKTGSYDLTIYYTPESYFSYAVIISLLSFVILSTVMGLHFYVKSRKKRPLKSS